MSISHITTLTELDKHLGGKEKLTVIDFHATWCQPCKIIAPTFERLSKEYPGANFVKVDVDEAQDVAKKYNVTAMPTFIFLKGSDHVHTIRGAQKDQLISSVEKYSTGSAATFQGQGHKLGDGSKGSASLDPRGKFNFGKELPVIAGLIAVYVFLMYYS